jgi:hypothetical protein
VRGYRDGSHPRRGLAPPPLERISLPRSSGSPSPARADLPPPLERISLPRSSGSPSPARADLPPPLERGLALHPPPCHPAVAWAPVPDLAGCPVL